MKVQIVKTPYRYLGFKPGDMVTHKELGDGVVVGFSSVSSEPFVFLYSRENDRPYCIGHEELSLLNE